MLSLAIDNYLATVRCIKAISDPHRRRLPRPIFTNDGMNRPRLNDNVDIVIGQNRSKPFRDVPEFEHVVSGQ